MEKIILASIEKHLKNNVMIRRSQHRFTKGKACLTKSISLYDKVTCPESGGCNYPGFS